MMAKMLRHSTAQKSSTLLGNDESDSARFFQEGHQEAEKAR